MFSLLSYGHGSWAWPANYGYDLNRRRDPLTIHKEVSRHLNQTVRETREREAKPVASSNHAPVAAASPELRVVDFGIRDVGSLQSPFVAPSHYSL